MRERLVWAGRRNGKLVVVSLRFRGCGADIKKWRREGLTVELEPSDIALAEFSSTCKEGPNA